MERRVRAGWRWLRSSNAYRFAVPEASAQPAMRREKQRSRRAATTGQNDRGGENLSKKEAIQMMMQEAIRLPDLLAMRRATFEERQMRGA
jgi:hypothetical protein